MTATDELRRLLDERDVKYQKLNEHVTWVFFEDRAITFFSDELGVSAEVSYPKPVFNGTKFLTPEQAIAATLGSEEKECAWYDQWEWDEVDVPVSDCPYCGCKRKVIHIHADEYEEPDDYFVEHADIKEAADCFTEYFAFRTAEEAVRHADARAKHGCVKIVHCCDCEFEDEAWNCAAPYCKEPNGFCAWGVKKVVGA